MKNEFTNVNAISHIKRTEPHITSDTAHYTCRPDADHQGHFFSVNRRCNPDDLRKVADMIERDRVAEKKLE